MSGMSPQVFKEIASDPTAWRQKARVLRDCAEALWDSYVILFSGVAEQPKDCDRRRAVVDQWIERLFTAQFLYGLVVETALKARLIECDPASVQFREVKDAAGNILDVRITKIGVELGTDGHDLVKLAQVAGVIDGDQSGIFSIESDRTAIREILAYLTDCVRWSGRYPAPKRMSEQYTPSTSIPSAVLGLHMREWLDPFLDALLADGSLPSEAIRQRD